MKVAVVTDIHGNLPALDAVIADIAARGCDAVVNLGDCLAGPLWPTETAARLMALGWPTVRGNHERQVLEGGAMGASDRFTRAAIGDAVLAWTAAMPLSRVEAGLFLCHAVPADDNTHWLFTVTLDGLRAATEAEVAARADGGSGDLLFCGHTHLPRTMTLPDGRRVTNPGSVGLQAFHDAIDGVAYRVAAGDPRARYAVVDGGAVELVAVDYDWQAASGKAAAEGFADWAHALATGEPIPL
jgi:predicted phosphodiesterase